ncbi:MAG: Ohr family peroxiredoxin [Hyphomicrobium sp.]
MLKVILTIQKRDDLSDEAFNRHYVDVHGPIVAKLPNLRRYIQNPWSAQFGPDEVIPKLVSPRLLGGISELWFDDLDAVHAAMKSEAWALSGEDLPKFTKAEATTMNVVDERVMIAGDADAHVDSDSGQGEALVREFYRAVAAGDGDAVRGVLADDWQEIPLVYPGQPAGAEGYLPIMGAFNAAFPDGRFDVHEVMRSGNRYTARTTATGTHSAEFFGREATGAAVRFDTIDIHEVQGGKITRSWHLEDVAAAQAAMDAGKPKPGPERVLFTAKASATGGRNGHTQSDDGIVAFDLSVPKDMGGPGKEGTATPEHLFAAGYAACFGSALDYVARQQHVDVSAAKVHSDVGIGPRPGGGFALAVTLIVDLAGHEQAAAEALVAAAHKVCPYSNAIAGNVPVDLRVTV